MDNDEKIYLSIRSSVSFRTYFYIEKRNAYGGVINPRLFLKNNGELVKILGDPYGGCYYKSKQEATEIIERYFDVLEVKK